MDKFNLDGMLSFARTKRYMQEMIDERRSSDAKTDCEDLFKNLLDANAGELERSDSRLSNNELIGDY